jgi:putative membrane protein
MRKMTHLIAAAAALSVAHLAGAAELSKKDIKYMHDTAQRLMSEVKMGEMAQKQASDGRVREFGKKMVDDHGKELDELKQIASQKGVTLPDEPSKEQKQEAAKLAKMSGAAFDKEYVQYEVKDHKKDVKDQGEEMKETSDPDLKKFATSGHETVSTHKQIIDQLHKHMAK